MIQLAELSFSWDRVSEKTPFTVQTKPLGIGRHGDQISASSPKRHDRGEVGVLSPLYYSNALKLVPAFTEVAPIAV